MTLPGADYEAYISAPAGYASPAPVKLTAAKPTATVKLEKAGSDATTGNNNGSSNTTTDSDSSDKPAANKTYTVTVTDAAGKGQSGIVVKFIAADGNMAAMVATNAKGAATATLKAGNYKAELTFNGTAKGYDKNAAVLTADKTAVTVIVADGISGTPVEVYGGEIIAEPVRLGATYVELLSNATANDPNYFCFTPTQTGVYRFTTSNPAAVIENWGNNPQFISRQTEYVDTNIFTINVKNLDSPNFILGIHGADECVVLIERTGDAVLGIEDLPYETYKTTAKLQPFTKPTGTKTYVDISKSHTAVLGDDGYYHLDSKTGPKLYMDFDNPIIPFGNALENGAIRDTIYDEDGKFVKKIEFITCLNEYYGYTDNSTGQWVNGYVDDGIYPLTADLVYILQTHTENVGWNDPEDIDYIFTGKTVDADTAWMFCVCTFG